MTVPSWPRALDPAERYFWLLDRLACLPVAAIAELDRVVDPGELVPALAAVQRRHPLLRARIDVVDGQPVLVEAVGPIPMSVVAGASWTHGVATLLDTPFPDTDGPLARLVSLPLDSGRSAVVLQVHHALVDGRGITTALLELLRQVDRGTRAPSASTPAAASPPPPLHDRFAPALRAPGAVRDVLGQVRAERDGLAAPGGYPFHARGVPTRRTRLDLLEVEPVSTLVSAARDVGATVQGLLGAAALQSGATLLGGSEAQTLALASPTDLRRHVELPLADDEVMLAVGLLCTPYRVAGDEPELARRISEQTKRELSRGESHLFYRFARSGSFAATEDGLDAFARWTGTTPENIGVSNLGTVRDEGDPDWVRSLSFGMSPSANQLAFIAATTYRGRLVILVTTDEEKLPRSHAEQFVDGLAVRIGATRVEQLELPNPTDQAPAGRRRVG